MEAFFMTRGKSDEVDHLVKWLSTRGLPMPIKKADGTVMQTIVETQIRPVQLWGFVFPKECEDMVVNSLGIWGDGNRWGYGEKSFYNINPKIFALRKLLGLRKIEEPKNKNDKMFMPYERWKDVNLIGIGIKDDGEIADTTHERI